MPEASEPNGAETKPVPPTPTTPQQNTTPVAALPPPQSASSGSGRMVTRVSSGAIRHKSIGELLGEAPKTVPTRTNDVHQAPFAIEATVPPFQETLSSLITPNPPNARTNEKVFQDSSFITPPSNRVELDRLQAAAEIFPLEHLVSKAHKSVRTSDWTKALEEKKMIAICNRISELKEQGLWSLRQPAKQKLPPRRHVHWDYLLKEMEWMSTDFYEERKLKMAGALFLARAVQQYHQAPDKSHLLHQVVLVPAKVLIAQWPRRIRAPVKHFEEETDADEDVLMVNHRESSSPAPNGNDAEPIQDVEKPLLDGDANHGRGTLVDAVKEQQELANLPSPSPSSAAFNDLPGIFDLPSDIIYAAVNELPKRDGSSLSQLPIYGPPTVTEEPYKDPLDECPIVPISKFCLERYIVPIIDFEPPRKTYPHARPLDSEDTLGISKEVQVEAMPHFAPAGGIHHPNDFSD